MTGKDRLDTKKRNVRAKSRAMPQRLPGAQPKHQVIYNQLKTEIAAGKYGAGMRLPSESQLVRHFRVSRPTAARALRDLQSAGLIERRAGVGSFAGRTTPATPDVRLLGLLIPGLGTTEIFEPICGEIASLARVHEYSVLWGGSLQPWRDTDASVDHIDQVCSQFIERGVSGVFFAPFAGYREALARSKLDLSRDAIQIGDAADVRFARSLVASARLDGVICGNDHTAALLLRSLELARVKVPRELRVAGFDDVKYAALLAVPLTTIRQPCRDMGEVAFRAMLERIAHPTLATRTMLLTPTLVVRESCGAYLTH